MPWVRWPPWARFMPRIRSPGCEDAEVGGHVGLGARVGLDVDVLGAGEEGEGALLGEPLGDVDVLAAAVVALARQALGVLVGEPRALRLHDRRGDVVLARDQLDLVVLAAALADAWPPRARGRPRRSTRAPGPSVARWSWSGRLLPAARASHPSPARPPAIFPRTARRTSRAGPLKPNLAKHASADCSGRLRRRTGHVGRRTRRNASPTDCYTVFAPGDRPQESVDDYCAVSEGTDPPGLA